MLRYIFHRGIIDPTYQGTSTQLAIWVPIMSMLALGPIIMIYDR